MSKSILETLSNVFGRVKHSALRQYAEQVGEEVFLENIRCPCLVGVGRFAGEFVSRAKDDRDVTMAFRPAVSGESIAVESEETGIHETVYPLQVPADRIAHFKHFGIGRSSSNDIVIPDYSISDRHANILYEKREYRLEDLLSTNGTLVNGLPVSGKGVELHDGDKIKLGRFRFILVWPVSLYKLLTLVGRQPPPPKPAVVLLEELTDAVGKFDFICLKQYCRTHSVAEFAELLVHPVLVGSAFFPGSAWSNPDEEVDTALALPPSRQSHKARLLAGSMYPLSKSPLSTTNENTFIVGRGVASDLRMNDPTISKQHARIEFKGGKLWLSDLGSSNGTLLDIRPLQPFMPREIREGHKVSFGNTHFVLVSPDRLYKSLQTTRE
ncbi:MAG: FHA domain-containing protein [Magnetococcales bacterium]|nr:FHA domain-containing protein [Magnetococcales bacterium]